MNIICKIPKKRWGAYIDSDEIKFGCDESGDDKAKGIDHVNWYGTIKTDLGAMEKFSLWLSNRFCSTCGMVGDGINDHKALAKSVFSVGVMKNGIAINSLKEKNQILYLNLVIYLD